MNRRLGLACFAIFATFDLAAVDAQEKPKLKCDRGGDIERYGGTEWMLYGCSDGKTLVFVTAQDNPAIPFYFVLSPRNDGYHLFGQGTGDKRLTDAAYADIQALTPAQIDALLGSRREPD